MVTSPCVINKVVKFTTLIRNGGSSIFVVIKWSIKVPGCSHIHFYKNKNLVSVIFASSEFLEMIHVTTLRGSTIINTSKYVIGWCSMTIMCYWSFCGCNSTSSSQLHNSKYWSQRWIWELPLEYIQGDPKKCTIRISMLGHLVRIFYNSHKIISHT